MSGDVEKLILCQSDIRQSPTQAPFIHRVNAISNGVKIVSMAINTGNQWIYNPKAHLYVLVNGWMKPGDPKTSLQGWGVCFGHTPLGTGVAFEHFGAPDFMVGSAEELEILPNTIYMLDVLREKEWVQWTLHGANANLVGWHRFEAKDRYPSDDTIIGLAGDTESATISLYDVTQEIRKYKVDSSTRRPSA